MTNPEEAGAVTGSRTADRGRTVAAVLFAILAVSLGLRLLYLANQSSMAIPSRHPDTFLYDMIPRHLLAGDGYVGEDYLIAQKGRPTAFYGPVYPLFVSAVYGSLGYDFLYVQLLQIVISVATCWLVYVIGSRLYGPTAGLIAAGLFAVYPELVAYPSAILSETVFLFLEILLVYLLVRILSESDEELGAAKFAVTGGVFAIAFLCRQVILLTPLVLAPIFILRHRSNGWGWMMKRAGVFSAVAVLLVAPWSVRNYLAIGTFSPGTTTGGVTFWWGNNTDRRGMDLPTALDEVKRANPGLSEVEMNSLLYRMGIEQIVEKGPIGMVRLAWSKWWKIWMPYLFYEGRWRALGMAQYAVIYTLLATGVYGSIALVKRYPGTLAVTVVLVSGVLTNLATIGNSRYSLPYMPLLMIASAPVLMALAKWTRERVVGRQATGMADG